MRSRLLNQHPHFLASHFNTVRLADFGQQQAQTHAAFRNRLVFVLLVLDLLERRNGVLIIGGFLLQLRPDLREFSLNHRGRHFKAVPRSQLIEQRALHLGAGQASGLLFQLRLHDFLQLLKAIQPEVLGEIFVNLGFGFDFHRFHSDVEGRFLACQMFGLIFSREGNGDGLFLPCLHAHQLVFKAGDEGARTQHQRRVFGLATVKFDAVQLADEIDDQLVAVRRLLGLGRVLVAFVLARDTRQRFVNLRVGYRHHQLFQLEAIGARRINGREHFEADAYLRVLAFRIIFIEADFGLHRGAQRFIAQQLIDRFANRVVHHLPMQGFAVHFLDEIGGHLARAEAGHPHLRGHLLDLGVDLRGEIGGGDRDEIGALEPFVDGLLGLHGDWSEAFLPKISVDAAPSVPNAVRGEFGAGEGTRTPTSCDTRT